MRLSTSLQCNRCPRCQTRHLGRDGRICLRSRRSQQQAAVGIWLQREREAGPAPVQDSLIGGRYAIEGSLGDGGMGTICRARHVLLHKNVAIKVLRNATDQVARRRFLQEARAASRVHHPNVVDICDFGTLPDGSPFLVMELLEGRNLDQVLQDGALPAARACHIAAQIAHGLQAVHDSGIIHRDLKPANVFLLQQDDQPDFVKIVDFGIAKVLSGPRMTLHGLGPPRPAPMPSVFIESENTDPKGALTLAGMVVGTPEYMSPEQSLGEELDHRVDQYALGCMLYEMLTGDLPFTAKNTVGLMRKHVSEPVQPPRQRRPDLPIPAEVEAVVLRLLSKTRAARYPSMHEVELALRAALASMERHAAPVTPYPRTYASLRPLLLTRLSPRPILLTGSMLRLPRPHQGLWRRLAALCGLLLLLGVASDTGLPAPTDVPRTHGALHPSVTSSAFRATFGNDAGCTDLRSPSFVASES